MPNLTNPKYRAGRRLGRKKAADPRDRLHLARDNPRLSLVADPRDTGVVHSTTKARLQRAGLSLTDRAMSLGISPAYADLPKLVRTHKRSGLFPLDQNGYSACVGFAMIELGLAGPIMQHLNKLANLFNLAVGPAGAKDAAERIALEWYRRAQEVDEWPGAEPTYEGTSGRAGAKVGQSLGLWPSYDWLTSLEEVVRYLVLHGPVPSGMDFFTSDMDPEAKNYVKGRKEVTALLTAEGIWEGGHEMLLDYVNIKTERLGGPQTWGESPSQSPYERWEMTFETFAYRLSQGADALAIPEVRIPS